jgi:hypothetical protein
MKTRCGLLLSFCLLFRAGLGDRSCLGAGNMAGTEKPKPAEHQLVATCTEKAVFVKVL